VTTITFQPGKILIISSFFLICTIYLISPVIASSNDSFEEAKVMKRAYDFLNEGEIEYALQLYDQLLKVNPTHIKALNYKGLALASLGHYDEAILWYDKVLDIDPNDLDAEYNRSIALDTLHKSNESTVLSNDS
jgi:tetratricopeptide (TPR) repeat protein